MGPATSSNFLRQKHNFRKFLVETRKEVKNVFCICFFPNNSGRNQIRRLLNSVIKTVDVTVHMSELRIYFFV